MNLLRGQQRRRLRQHRRVVEEIHQGGQEVLHGEYRRLVGGRGLHLRPGAKHVEADAGRRPTCTSAPTRPSAASNIHWTPDTGDVPLVADMSSHILSRPVDVSKFGVIYGGAQKNIGPAGLTLVIVRDDLLDRALPITPSAFHWKEQAAADSMLNTPPTYAIYIAGLVFEWLQAQGGLAPSNRRTSPRRRSSTTTSTGPSFYRNTVRKRRPLAHERAVQAAPTKRWTRRSSKAPGSAAWCSSRATARSAACARRSTTRCRSTACRRSSSTCTSSSDAR